MLLLLSSALCDDPLLSLSQPMDIAAYIEASPKWPSTLEESGNTLTISPDTLMVVRTSTNGASGMLTVELPVYVILPLSLEEIFESKSVITCVCGDDPSYLKFPLVT
jgi:hypothetical protein